MPSLVTVAYPRPSGGKFKFDLDYYIATHMRLVSETWEPVGLQSWTVTDHIDDDSQPYVITAALVWNSLEDFATGESTEAGKKVFGDIPNFTDIKPIVIKGDIKAAWKAGGTKL